MADVRSRGAASPAAAVGEPDALLATKLHQPSVRPGFVPRPQLVDRLEEGLAGALMLVCVPAGFGKTALLADWARSSPRPVAWLSPDAGDNDPARFWRYVAGTLERARLGLGERLAAVADASPGSPEAVVTALLNELAAQPGEVALVLDDYHAIEAGAVHGSRRMSIIVISRGIVATSVGPVRVWAHGSRSACRRCLGRRPRDGQRNCDGALEAAQSPQGPSAAVVIRHVAELGGPVRCGGVRTVA